MYHQVGIQQFYVLPTQLIFVFCVDERKTAIISLYNVNRLLLNSDLTYYIQVVIMFTTSLPFNNPTFFKYTMICQSNTTKLCYVYYFIRAEFSILNYSSSLNSEKIDPHLGMFKNTLFNYKRIHS